MGLLDIRTFLVKEQVGFMKLTDKYDIYDAATNEPLGRAEEQPGPLATYLRLILSKKLMPTKVVVTETGSNEPLFTIHRGVALFSTRVTVNDAQGEMLGYFKSKVFSLGGGFYLFNPLNEQVGEVKGDWKGWNFKLLSSSGAELGTVAKKWAGLAKEFFTSADNYVISLGPEVGDDQGLATLLLAAGLAIDTVFKEKE